MSPSERESGGSRETRSGHRCSRFHRKPRRRAVTERRLARPGGGRPHGQLRPCCEAAQHLGPAPEPVVHPDSGGPDDGPAGAAGRRRGCHRPPGGRAGRQHVVGRVVLDVRRAQHPRHPTPARGGRERPRPARRLRLELVRLRADARGDVRVEPTGSAQSVRREQAGRRVPGRRVRPRAGRPHGVAALLLGLRAAPAP